MWRNERDEEAGDVSETPPARLWAFDVVAPGEVRLAPGLRGMSGRLVYATAGVAAYDSLAVEAI